MYDTVALLIEGMGGGIELVGGLWLGLVSLAALRADVLSPWLNRTDIATGVAGVATTTLLAPEVVTSVLGAGCIVRSHPSVLTRPAPDADHSSVGHAAG